MACCIVNQYIYIYAVQHSYCTAVCPSAAFPTILAPYKVYAGGTGHACYSPLLCLLFSTFPLSLTYDRCMRPHINFSTWLFPRHFVSLFQDKHCHLFGLLTTKKLHTGKLQHYMFFFSSHRRKSVSLWAVVTSNKFIFSFFMLEVNKLHSPSQSLFHFPTVRCARRADRAAGNSHTEQDAHPV